MNLKIILPNKDIRYQEFPINTSVEEIIEFFKKEIDHKVYACKIDNYAERLDFKISEDCCVELLDVFDSYGNMVMRTSLIQLYIKAIHDVLGESVEIKIANSLSKGIFTHIKTDKLNEKIVRKIKIRMQELIDKDIPFEQTYYTRREILKWLRKNDTSNKLDLFETAPDADRAYLTVLDNEKELQYYHSVPSTRYLNLFDLKKYRSGVLLRFCNREYPDSIPPFCEQKVLYNAFSEEISWETLMDVNYVSELNRKVEQNQAKQLIQVSEALHEKRIAELAQKIYDSKKRIILIAGPSSSGKTSFAKRLCVQLQVAGLKPLYLCTDDYFLNREEMIPDENGHIDFEGLDAVDVKLFTSQMNDLLEGKEVDIPTFNFIDGKKEYNLRVTKIKSTQPIVIEGIHGLNPKMTEGISDDEKFKIYISPLTQINLDNHHRIPTTDCRLIRRMVRDYRTRGRSAIDTIDSWMDVRDGEQKNIFPYCAQADDFFNSSTIYELAVLKKYAEPLLKSIHDNQKEYNEAQRLLNFLGFFETIQDDYLLPNNSIVREFIGGSILVD